MANVFLGSVYASMELRDSGMDAGVRNVRDKLSSVQEQANKMSFAGFARNAANNLDSVADSLGRVLKGAVAVGVTGSVGVGAMTKAAFDQVRQVENASFALRAYETDADKVNQILGELVAYARSDMGVLFQRQDLFKAASNLRGFGIEADKVTGYVKILSKGVSLGMTNFDELSQILGRVAQRGQLSAAEFDMLAQRGIILDSSFRGAKVTAAELFDELNTVLPDNLLEGRANTIDGAMIRLQSAFRDLGSAVLDVDKETSQFVKGGLGDTLMKALDGVRETLRDPAFVEAFKTMGAEIGKFATESIPKILEFARVVAENFDKVVLAIKILVPLWAGLKAAALGFKVAAGVADTIKGIGAAMNGIKSGAAIAKGGFDTFRLGMMGVTGAAGFFGKILNGLGLAVRVVGLAFKGLFTFLLTNPIGWIILAVVGLVAAFVLLWNNVEGFRNFFIGAWEGIKAGVAAVSEWFTGTFVPAMAAVWEGIKVGVQSVGEFFGAIWNGISVVATTIFTTIMEIYNATLKPVFDGIIYVVTAIGTVFWTIFSGILQIVGIVISTIVQIIGVVLYGSFMWLWNNILVPTGQLFASIFNAIRSVVSTVLGVISSVVRSVMSAVWGFLQPILQSIGNFFKTIFNGIRNAVTTVFNFLKPYISAIWNSISSVFSSIIGGIKSAVSAGFNFIKNKIVEPIKEAYEKVKGFVSDFLAAGKDIIDGIVKGVADGKDAVVGKIKEICSGALDAVKSFFGIQSPSKVMAKMFGYVGEGAVVGIEKSKKSVLSAFDSAFNQLPSLNTDSMFADASGMTLRSGTMKVEPGKGFGSTESTNIYGDVRIDNGNDQFGIVEKLNRGAVLARKGMTTDV